MRLCRLLIELYLFTTASSLDCASSSLFWDSFGERLTRRGSEMAFQANIMADFADSIAASALSLSLCFRNLDSILHINSCVLKGLNTFALTSFF
ncbi:hypothetical protein K469DRAFT_804488 [Zopfia rhizophila CBS 207.26]|uniref:Secreted protein n=1 Tax=Zopfia rhizophila CBS 207.26 TaxID=1314779 RepID=A0A6A6EKN4_9PEZI|nr:hypothetical protein K469DRAFT_804488 [Zopfia rhizophila CBS 207.26]